MSGTDATRTEPDLDTPDRPAQRPDRALLAAVAGLALAGLVIGLGRSDFWPPDEARVAEIAREMTASDWLVPRFNGRPFVEEPPLFYWLQAATYRAAGRPSTSAARFPSAVAAVIGALATAALARRLGVDPLVTTVVLATSPEYWWMARSATPDIAAAAATTIGLGLFFVVWRSGAGWLLVPATFALGVAFWCKSLLPLGLAVLALGVFVAIVGAGRLSPARLVAVALGLAALGATWVLLLAGAVGPDAARFFVITNHFGRLVGVEQGHVRPVLYYVSNLALDLLPWSLVLPVAVAVAWRGMERPERLFPLAWAGCVVVALSLSVSKRAHYLLPAYPALALLVAAWWMNGSPGRVDRLARRLLVLGVAALAPALALVLTSIRPPTIALDWRVERLPWTELAARARDWSPSPAAWALAAVVLLLGLALVRVARERRTTAVVALLGLQVVVLESVLTLHVLPGINRLSTARPMGEELARLAAGGVPVMTFAADGDAELPLGGVLFYAGRALPGTHDPATLADALSRHGGCAVMRRQDYPAVADVVTGTPIAEGPLASSRLLVIERPAGACSAASAVRARSARDDQKYD